VVCLSKAMNRKGDLSVETIIKIAIAVAMLFILAILVYKNSDAMKKIWEGIIGFF
jgi:hypothetical protein